MSFATSTIRPWKKDDVIETDRLNLWQSACVFEIRVQDGSPLTVIRNNNAVVIGMRSDNARSRLTVLVKITGNASGGGKYNGRILTKPTTTAAATGTLVIADVGVVPSADNALILNEEEIDLLTHWLKTNSYAIGYLDGVTASGLTIIVIPKGDGKTTSPNTLGGSTEGSETASTDTWTRNIVTSGTNYGDSALDIWITCRTVYNHAGDKKLYDMKRKLSFDARGLLIAVSTETRVEVDAAVVCT